MKITPRRLIVLAALGVLLITTAVGLRHRSINVDYIAFVCGGEAVREHANPYVMQPLYACEQRRLADLGRPELAEAVTPVPLPIYALIPFAALSIFSTKVSLLLWDVILVACTVLSVWLIRSMTRTPVPTIVAAIFIGGIYVSLALGQIVPVILAAIVTTAWAVDREHDLIASLAAAITMFEPNVGLPVCLTLFCIRPKARIPLLAVGGVFAAISAWIAPIAQTLDYFQHVLPAHAASEIHNDEQLSFTHLLSVIGMPDKIALLGGSISYLIAMLGGVGLALYIARERSLQRIAMLVGPSVATLGGTFLHVQQFTIVSILALLVTAMPAHAAKARYGLLLVALPLIGAQSIIDLVLYACIAVIISADVFRGNIGKIVGAAGVTIIATGIAHTVRTHHRIDPSQLARMHADVAAANQHAVIPEDVWRVFINENVFTSLGWNAIAFDVPLVIGSILTIIAAYECYAKRTQTAMEASGACS